MNKETYERELKERQRKHLEEVEKNKDESFVPCRHNECSECVGTFVKKDGSPCIHYISCPCPKCNPVYNTPYKPYIVPMYIPREIPTPVNPFQDKWYCIYNFN